MVWLSDGERKRVTVAGRNGKLAASGRVRLAKEILACRYRPGQSVQLRQMADEYELDDESILKTFAQFQALGMVTLSGNCSAIIHSPNPKEMHEAYEIRAALEEIAGRTAAPALKSNAAGLQNELSAMRAAVRDDNIDAYAEHDARFHRVILEASQNDVLLRVWDTLAFDLRIRAAIGKVSKHLHEVVEWHQPIVDALEKGRGREAGLLLRNHVETFLEYLKKSESDSGVHRALRRDLQGARDVQQAFFPPESLSIPCLSCATFYQPAHEIGGDYYDFLSLQDGQWGIAIGDVSGKGIGAALIMASLQASLRAQALHSHLDLSALVGDVNRLVFESSPTHFFASLFYGEYEPAARMLKYVNAGHNSPIVIRTRSDSTEILHLKSEGMPVGIAADAHFASSTFQLEMNDVLVAYTDGITEAQNRQGDFWGEQRLEGLLRFSRDKTPEQIIRDILDEVRMFANGHPQQDDMTLVVMRVQDCCGV